MSSRRTRPTSFYEQKEADFSSEIERLDPSPHPRDELSLDRVDRGRLLAIQAERDRLRGRILARERAERVEAERAAERRRLAREELERRAREEQVARAQQGKKCPQASSSSRPT